MKYKIFFFSVVAMCIVFLAAPPCDSQIVSKEKSRMWQDSTGNFQVEAVLVGAEDSTVALKKTDNDQRIEIDLQRLSSKDRAYVKEFREKVFDELKASLSQAVLAEQALSILADFQLGGFIDEETRRYVQDKTAEFTKLSETNSVSVGKQHIPLTELRTFKVNTSNQVRQWISEKSVQNINALKKIAKDDKTSLDSVIVLGLYMHLHARSLDSADFYFSDAISKGKLYEIVSDEADRRNLTVALNNAAVNHARQRQVGYAFRKFSEIPEDQYTDDIRFNISKLFRMVESSDKGLMLEVAQLRRHAELRDKSGSLSQEGGWRLLLPSDAEGRVLTGLDFLFSDPAKQRLASTYIEDMCCVVCSGTGLVKCESKLCQGGKEVETFANHKMIRNNRGDMVRVPFMDKRMVTCSTCRGTAQSRCRFCTGGIQK
jgi:hypothetical protein